MRPQTTLAVAFLALLLPPTGWAQLKTPSDKSPPREAFSDNKQYRLVIRAGQKDRRRCQGMLISQYDGRRRWRSRFVNEVAPEYVAVRNDGAFVVTLGEFRRGGAAHALAIYDKKGELLREFDLRELLRPTDWQHVRLRDKAIEWLTGAELEFVETPPQFLIKLRWERELRIDLTDLYVVGRKDAKPGEFATPNAKIPPELLALLGEPSTAPTSQPASQPTSQPAATAKSSTTQSAAGVTDEQVAQALAELGELAGDAGMEVEGLETPAASQPATQSRRPDASSARPAAEPSPFAGNSDVTGRPVPAPDPANPANYVAWLNEQTAIDGPSAVPLYDSAIEQFVPWEGDLELYNAAMDGDPVALASPEIDAWLKANEAAIADYRAATKLEFNGWPTNLEEGQQLFDMQLPNLSSVRQLAKVTTLKGQQLAAAGDYDGAIDCYLDTAKAGSHTSNGVTLIEELVGIAVNALASDRIRTMIASADDDALDYVALAEKLDQRLVPVRPIEDSFQYERASNLDFLQGAFEVNPETGNYRVRESALEKIAQIFGDKGPESVSMQIGAGAVLAAEGYEHLVSEVNNHYDKLTEATRMPYADTREILSSIERPRSPALIMILPSLDRATQMAYHSNADRQATRLVAHLKAYRQQHGEYPSDLSVFADQDYVIDPFADAPFQYRREGDDFVLYSVGVNATDEGGIHDSHRHENDFVFWPRPVDEKD